MAEQAHTPIARIEMPYKVRFESPHGSPTYSPRTRQWRRTTSRYFETKAEAVAFCGDPRKVIYAPGEAWHAAVADGEGQS